MQQIIIQITFILLAFIESLHDEAVINIQNYSLKNYQELSNKWHNYSAMYYTVVVGLICYLNGHYLLAIPLLLIRLTFFDLFLNFRRGKPIFYLGNKGFDLFMTKLLGAHAGLIQFVGGIAIIIVINFYL